MPHAIVMAGSRVPVRDVVDLGHDGSCPQLRLQPVGTGELLLLAPDGGRIDGRVMLGGLAVVDWGAGALVRTRSLRVEIGWLAARDSRLAPGPRRCALCFGTIAAGAPMFVCQCETVVDPECLEVMLSCPSCGAPVVEGETA